MNSLDILFQVTTRLDNYYLQSLALTSSGLCSHLRTLDKNQEWWYRRTQQLCSGTSLTPRPGDWKLVYQSLSKHGLEFCYNQNYSSTLLISVLLEIGADPSNNYGCSISQACEADNLEGVQLLLSDSRIDLHYVDDPCLHACIENENRDMVRLFLDHDIVVYSSDVTGAIRTGDVVILSMLLELDQLPVRWEESEETYLRTAIRLGFPNIALMLLSDKRIDKNDLSALKEAANREYLDIVRLLLPYTDTHRLSPMLNQACKFGSMELAKILLVESGRDWTRPEINHARMLAQRHGREDVVKLIDERT